MNSDLVGAYADVIVTLLLRSRSTAAPGIALEARAILESFPSPWVLVINQTLENHERITDLLARMRKLRQLENRPAERPDSPHVAVYRLKNGVPVEKSIQLLRQLVPDVSEDNREGDQPTYLEPFGQGILVCHSVAVHRRIEQLLWSLDLCPRPPMENTGMGGGFQ